MHRTIQDYDFSYEGFMESAEQSLPLGNGDVGANVWLDRAGTLHLLFSKTDSWTELNRLVKTGHFSLALSPNPFAEGARFTLCLADGMLRIQAEKASVSLYADANAPCVRLLAEADAPLAAHLEVHNYRNRPLHFSYTNAYQYSAAEVADGLCESADRVFDVPGGVAVCHRNEGSCYRDMLRTQDMEGFAEDRPDPLDGRIFGVAAFAPGLATREHALVSRAPAREISLAFYSRSAQGESSATWAEAVCQLCDRHGTDARQPVAAHIAAWRAYWERCYVYVWGDEDAEALTRAYVCQRYLTHCADRGAYPIKFNGSIFTAHMFEELPGNYDRRRWGGAYWIQNTRLIYWHLLAAGDYEAMVPFFRMCLDAMPVCVERVARHFGHRGMLLPETVTFFGLYNDKDYGLPEERARGARRGIPVNHYIRFHFEGMLEIAYMMLRYLALSGEGALRQELYEFVRQVLLFFDEHFDKLDGRIFLCPVSSLETWQTCANDLPDIAGLTVLLAELETCADVPEALASLAARMRAELPALPMATENGARVLLPCETRIDVKTRNVENPELYAVFPFPLFGLGRADLQVARDTFERRRFRHGFGWCQDAIQAARLGLTDTVKNILVKAARMKDERAIFPAFFGPNFDETPDQDHGSNLCLALIYMLLQSDGTNALPFPAWPESWNARFRLPICAGRWICGECVDGQKTVREEGTLAGV